MPPERQYFHADAAMDAISRCLRACRLRHDSRCAPRHVAASRRDEMLPFIDDPLRATPIRLTLCLSAPTPYLALERLIRHPASISCHSTVDSCTYALYCTPPPLSHTIFLSLSCFLSFTFASHHAAAHFVRSDFPISPLYQRFAYFRVIISAAMRFTLMS